MLSDKNWFVIENPDRVFSPALLIYPQRIEENIRTMISTAGDPARLRPHVKTHKMPEIVRMQMKHGISRFKCATISEAEMTARCGASDILLAMQPAGPNTDRFFRLKKEFPEANISCIADTEHILRLLSQLSINYGTTTDIWLDINSGMNRTGIVAGEAAKQLFRLSAALPGINIAGLHAYDGHIHEKDFEKRKELCDQCFEPVKRMKAELESEGFVNIRVIAGGSPTFPVHALNNDRELSPGTVLLWDYGYSSKFADMTYLHAAVLLTRVISKPSDNLICIDLGHKAVSSEMPQPRVYFPELQQFEITGHNEEHMVVKTPMAENYRVGDILYALPWHICPTVDRYDRSYVVKDGSVYDQWIIEARKRQLTF